MPPEAITVARSPLCKAAVARTSGPALVPSRSIAVKSTAATPHSSTSRARSRARTPVPSSQPCTFTSFSCASMATTTQPGRAAQSACTSAGSRTAAVPSTTRAAPTSSQRSALARVRMPPPSCTRSGAAAKMRSITATFPGSPSRAPSRSTTCKRVAPASKNVLAHTAGSSPYTVAAS